MNAEKAPTLVIVGCSPSNLTGLIEFFRGIPGSQDWCALLVDQSDLPDSEALRDAIRTTLNLESQVLTDGAPLSNNKIYIVPPGHRAEIRNNRFWLIPEIATDTLPGDSADPQANQVASETEQHLRAEIQEVRTQLEKTIQELERYRQNMEQIIEERSRELERSRQLLEQTGQVARVGGWELDATNQRLEWTHATSFIFDTEEGLQPDLDSMLGYFLPEDQSRLKELISLSIDHGQPFDQELRMVSASGNEKWIVISARPILESQRCVRIYGSIQDITERKRFEESLKRTTNLLLRTEHVASLGSWEWDLESEIVTWSDELFNIFGIPVEEGPPSFSELDTIYTPESLSQINAAVKRSIEKKIPYFLEIEAFRRDGKRIFGIASGMPIKDFNGRVVKLYGSFQDITGRALAQQEAIKAREEAEKANRAKTVFLGNLSHELRTPMNAIIGMTELALEEDLESDTRDYLETVRHASSHLMEIISDLLDSAVIEKGMLELSEETFSIRKAVQRSISVMGPEIQSKGLAFKTIISEEIPDHVIGDPRRFTQILLNLLGNASKYTLEGEVNLFLNLTSRDQDEEKIELEIRVEDTGPGIAEENQEYIFDKFTQVEVGANRLVKHSSGTGMGLYITRSIVEAMKGSISVQSHIGAGSSFIVSVPLRTREPGYSAVHEMRKSLPSLSILMAEDNAINALVQKTVLEQEGHSVVTVGNGHEAIETLSRSPFDLVLMDLEMPVLDGFQATKSIRDGQAGPDRSCIPIVAITAHVLAEVEEHCREAGMNGFITKPIDVKALGENLSDILKGNSSPHTIQ